MNLYASVSTPYSDLAADFKNTEIVHNHLMQLSFVKAVRRTVGCYKGEQELSLMVEFTYGSGQHEVERLISLFCKDYKQECVMVQYDSGNCWLAMPNHNVKLDGKMQETPLSKVKAFDAYTLIGSSYYTVR